MTTTLSPFGQIWDQGFGAGLGMALAGYLFIRAFEMYANLLKEEWRLPKEKFYRIEV